MEGRTLSFGESDLAATVAAYDPKVFSAPLVIGHPTRDDAPAYGWVGGLASDGGVLSASFSEISPEAKKLVDDGHYRHVSASFYAPTAPSNPVPGSFYLRHVGLLGAAAPAVKGLGHVSFSVGADSADDIVTISFGEMERDTFWSLAALARGIGRWMRRSRDVTIDKDGLEVADRLTSEWDVAEVEGAAARFSAMAESAAAKPDPFSFAQPLASPTLLPKTGDDPTMTPEEIAALKAENEKLKADNVSFSEAAASAAALARQSEDKAFVKALVDKGVLAPAHQDGVASFMSKLDASDTVSFSEGAAAQTQRDYFKSLLDAATPIINFAEVSAAKNGVVNPGNADEIAAAITAKVKEAEARGETLSYADASVAVSGAAAL